MSAEKEIDHLRIAFVGAGAVGATLAEAMDHAGLRVVAIYSRNTARAAAVAARVSGSSVALSPQAAADSADLVFLTVSDDAIAEVCASIEWHRGHMVVHCSGATELSTLNRAAQTGALTGSFHPLQMFADRAVALRTLPGCSIAIEADQALDRALVRICSRLSCRAVRLPPGHRALYHASAYYVGPFLIALMQEAVRIWQALGLSERDALVALEPLLQGTVAAVMERGLANAMGGCVARGDVGTVRGHLHALGELSPDLEALYRQLALRTIPLGQVRGTLDDESAATLRVLLEG